MFKFSACLFILLAFTSCIGNRKYSPIQYYDFGQTELYDLQLNIDTFNVEGPYKERCISRAKDNQLIVKEYQRWAQAPDLLLSHYLKQSFKPGSSLYLSGEILTIEHDLMKNEAIFKVIYIITKDARNIKQVNFQRIIPTNGSFDDFIAKTSQAVREMTNEISTTVKDLN